MTDDKKLEEFAQIQTAHEAFQRQLAAKEAEALFNEAVANIARLTPAERAALRKKKQKAAQKQEIAAKKERAKNLEVRQVLRRFNPKLTRGQVRNMADDYIAAEADKPKG